LVAGAPPLSPTSVYDTPQDQSQAIKTLLKENQNLKLKARCCPARARSLRALTPLQMYYLEEKFRREAQRLGAPGGFDALLEESMETQLQLKAAQAEAAAKAELLGASRSQAPV